MPDVVAVFSFSREGTRDLWMRRSFTHRISKKEIVEKLTIAIRTGLYWLKCSIIVRYGGR